MIPSRRERRRPSPGMFAGRRTVGIALVCDGIAAHREWRNDLTGNWGFSDPYEMMQLKFDRKEDAIRFCKTQGFYYEVEELPPQFPPVFKQYADKIQPPAVLSKMRAVVEEGLIEV